MTSLFGNKNDDVTYESTTELTPIEIEIDNDNNDVNYNDILDQDKKRLKYRERSFINGFRILFFFQNTALVDVIHDKHFWFTVLVYISTRLSVLYGRIKADSSPMSIVGTVGGFMSFLLVFFLSECYSRYKIQYQEQVKGSSSLVSTARFIKSVFSNKERSLQMIRYLNVAHIIAYIGMSKLYNEHNLLIPLVKEYNLLTKQELETVLNLNPVQDGKMAMGALIHWVHEGIIIAIDLKESQASLAGKAAMFVESFRNSMCILFSYQAVSVPFVYIHLVDILCFVYCPLFSFAIGLRPVYTNYSIIAEVLVISIVNIFISGIYGIARRLQDTIGDDAEDLSVIGVLKETIELCRGMDTKPPTPVLNPTLEQEIVQCKNKELID